MPQVIKSQKCPPRINRKALTTEGQEDCVIVCKVNQQLVLQVPVEGAPEPVTTWYKGDTELKSDELMKVSERLWLNLKCNQSV